MRRFWPILAVFVAVVYVGVDNLVPRSDWTYINRNGWIMYCWLLIPWTALLVAPALLFGKWSRWFYYPAVALLSVVETVTMFVRWQFKGQMNGAWITLLMDTSSRELGLFLAHYVGLSFVLVGLAVVGFTATAFWAVSHVRRLRPTGGSVALGLACVGLFLLLTPFCSAPRETLESRSSVFFLVDAFRNWERYDKLSEMNVHPRFPEGLRRDPRTGGDVRGVFVIGESATRNRWHLYGYPRQTTPCVESLSGSLIAFSNVTAAAIRTVRAMPLLLTTATLEREDDLRYSLPQVLSRLGYRTTLFSSQERVGRFCGSETYVFAGCEETLYLSETGTGACSHDDALLPFLRKELEKGSDCRPRVVFLHLVGSHEPVVENYPLSFNPFGAQTVRNWRDWKNAALMSDHYDNSIAFTDRILGEIVAELKKRGGPAWMVYLSDHGESPGEKSWRTETCRDVWEIPMIVWFSSDYRERFPEVVSRLEAEAVRSHRVDHLLDMCLSIAGVETE